MVFMTYRLVLDEHRQSCERLVQRVLRLVWQQQHVHERLVHFLIHYKTKRICPYMENKADFVFIRIESHKQKKAILRQLQNAIVTS